LEIVFPISDGVVGEDAQCGFPIAHCLRDTELLMELPLCKPKVPILEIGCGKDRGRLGPDAGG